MTLREKLTEIGILERPDTERKTAVPEEDDEDNTDKLADSFWRHLAGPYGKRLDDEVMQDQLDARKLLIEDLNQGFTQMLWDKIRRK